MNADPFDRQIEHAIHERMAALGYRRATGSEPADLQVTYGVLLTRSEMTPMIITGTSATTGQPLGMDFMASDVDGVDNQRKVLLVLLQERHSNRVVWMAASSADVTEIEVEGTIARAVEHVMERVPRVGRWE